MMNPEPSPTRSAPCSGAPGPPPGGISGMKRLKNSYIGSFSSRAPLRLACAAALLVVMTFTTTGPRDFMNGGQSGRPTPRSPWAPGDDAAACVGVVWTASGPGALAACLLASGGFLPHAASETATSPAMNTRRNVMSIDDLECARAKESLQ